MATNAEELKADLERARAQAAAARAKAAEAQANGQVYLVAQFNAQAERNESNAGALQIQYDLAVNSPGTASSGQVVAEEQQARADNAVVSNPVEGVEIEAIPTQQVEVSQIEFGTDGRIRPQTQTQSTPPAYEGNAVPYQTQDDSGVATPTPTFQAGATANRDDNPAPTGQGTAQIINASFNQRIRPEPNVLDAYSSYTYSISWYLLTPDQYNQMTRTQKPNCASWQLLIQSAGAPTGTAGANGNTTATAGRNRYFQLDYYIDDLEIDSLVPLKGTGAANTATDIKFRVTEPNGLTLIENLYKAVSTLYKSNNVSPNANYLTAQYCLVIRFYGYDENGELTTTGRRGANGATNLTDPKAIVEKFYPFVVTNIRFRIPKDRVAEYEVSGKPIPHFYNKSQDRGTIPFAFELIGETVQQVLIGKPVGTQYPVSAGERRDSPQPNTSAPTQTPDNVIQGTANEEVGGGTINSLGMGA